MLNTTDIAFDLQRANKIVKSFFRDEYPEKIKPYKHIINETIKANNIEALPALLKISETEMFKDNEFSQIFFFSATVDIIYESSKNLKP